LSTSEAGVTDDIQSRPADLNQRLSQLSECVAAVHRPITAQPSTQPNISVITAAAADDDHVAARASITDITAAY